MFDNKTVNELKKYIGKPIYIYNPGVEPDPYFGMQDVSSAHMEQKVIMAISIVKNGICIKTQDGKEYDINDTNLFMHINDLT